MDLEPNTPADSKAEAAAEVVAAAAAAAGRGAAGQRGGAGAPPKCPKVEAGAAPPLPRPPPPPRAMEIYVSSGGEEDMTPEEEARAGPRPATAAQKKEEGTHPSSSRPRRASTRPALAAAPAASSDDDDGGDGDPSSSSAYTVSDGDSSSSSSDGGVQLVGESSPPPSRRFRGVAAAAGRQAPAVGGAHARDGAVAWAAAEERARVDRAAAAWAARRAPPARRRPRRAAQAESDDDEDVDDGHAGEPLADDDAPFEGGAGADAQPSPPLPAAPCPPEMVIPLLPYQRQFLSWALAQEASPVAGGILADEMGMGKTCQAIALLLAGRSPAQKAAADARAVAAAAAAAAAGPNAPGGSASAAASAASRLRFRLLGGPDAPAPGEDAAADLALGGVGAGWTAGDPASLEEAVALAVAHSAAHTLTARFGPRPPDGPAAAAAAAATGCAGCAGGAAAPPAPPAPRVPSGATLVVCPVSALVQWKAEIDRFVAPGVLPHVLIYHGPKRTTEPAVLAAADVVLTSYATLEYDFRRGAEAGGEGGGGRAPGEGPKVKCGHCGKAYTEDALVTHLTYFCGSNASRTAAQAKAVRKDEGAAGAAGAPGPGGGWGRGRGARSAGPGEAPTDEDADDDDSDWSGGGGGGGCGGSKKRKAPGGDSKGKGKGKGKAKAPAGHGRGRGRGRGRGAGHHGRGGSPAAPRGPSAPPAPRSHTEWDDPALSDPDAPPSGWRSTAHRDAARMIKNAAVARAESVAAGRGPLTSTLHRVAWRRVILDEAHNIKAKDSSTARAAYGLTSTFRWCLSGTPLQNRVNELYSLLRFLRVWPFAYFLCAKGMGRKKKPTKPDPRGNTCQCASLHGGRKARGAVCANEDCAHPPTNHYSWWNRFSACICRGGGGERAEQGRRARALSVLSSHASQRSRPLPHPNPHFPTPHHSVLNPLNAYGAASGQGADAMRLLRGTVLDAILLRRTKEGCADTLMLPPRLVQIRRLALDAREQDFYEALYTQSRAQFGDFVAAGTLLNNYAHIFDLLVRLRQAVLHPYLVVHSRSTIAAAAGAAASAAAAAPPSAAAALAGECPLCHDAVEDGILGACGHAYCRLCVRHYMAGGAGGVVGAPAAEAAGAAAAGRLLCPAPGCAAGLAVDLAAARASTPDAGDDVTTTTTTTTVAASTKPTVGMVAGGIRVVGGVPLKKGSILTRIDPATFQTSSKIECLREELDKLVGGDPGAKAIVFSQFTSFLELIAFRLEQVGYRVVRLEGGMGLPARAAAIEAFTTDPSVTVFLLSLKAGGVALNLTCASAAVSVGARERGWRERGWLEGLIGARARSPPPPLTSSSLLSIHRLHSPRTPFISRTVPDGSVVEPGRREPGGRPGAPAGRVQAVRDHALHHFGERRGAHRQAATEEGGRLRGDGRQERRRPGSPDA